MPDYKFNVYSDKKNRVHYVKKACNNYQLIKIYLLYR